MGDRLSGENPYWASTPMNGLAGQVGLELPGEEEVVGESPG